VSESATTEAGTVGWTYQVANSATQYLAVGQTATEQFTVTVNDGHGGTVSQLVVVTVTVRTIHRPSPAALTDAIGAVTEDASPATLSDTGTIAFNDVDLIDVHRTSVSPARGQHARRHVDDGCGERERQTRTGHRRLDLQVANTATLRTSRSARRPPSVHRHHQRWQRWHGLAARRRDGDGHERCTDDQRRARVRAP
jgi:VCBS repeat-containing protein